MLGNKVDLDKLRRISPEQGNAMAEKYDLKFFEVSAKTGLNLEEAFSSIATGYHTQYGSFMEQVLAAADGS